MHIINFFGFLIISTCFWVSHANDSKDQEQIDLLSGKVSFIIPKDFDDSMLVPINIGAMTQKIIDSIVIK